MLTVHSLLEGVLCLLLIRVLNVEVSGTTEGEQHTGSWLTKQSVY
jgi:hypothetical protein